MPELPEVQTTVSGLAQVLPGLKITGVWTNYDSAYHDGKNNIKNKQYFSQFEKDIVGRKVTRVSRRAKNVLIHLSGDVTILVHMKMTGHLLYGKFHQTESNGVWEPAEDGPLRDPFNKFIRLVFSLSNKKHVALSDMRRFAKVTLLNTRELDESTDLRALGPEPLEKTFTLNIFKQRLQKRPRGKVKTVLMMQDLISGIGNIYSDEILWDAGVHPLSIVGAIPAAQLKKMFTAMKLILAKGINFGGDSMSDYRNIDGERGRFQHEHRAYRRTGKKCTQPGCGGMIAREVLGARSAHFCPVHQELYK